MSRLDMMTTEQEPDYDSDEGALLWEDDDIEEVTGSLAQASLTSLGAVETTRRGGASGRAFEHMKRILAGAEIEEPEFPHTLIAFRDSGFEGLKPYEKESLNVEQPKGQRLAATVMANHYLDTYVSNEFLDGETEQREMIVNTLDPEVKLEILPPRVPKNRLPAGARVEEPILRLVRDDGVLIKQTTARRTYDRNPADPFQQVIVVNEPLNKWARPKRTAAAAKAPAKK